MRLFEQEINQTQEWFDSPRFAGIVRLYTARQVVEQRGTIGHDYTIAREAAAAFYDRLCELFAERKSITIFGRDSPGQAVAMKRMDIEAIYLGGWATSAKGGTSEDPGPDLAGYPLSQVPDEAATLVRALLSADRNQRYLRSRMTEAQRAATKARDFRPFIIADADTGHGGDPHVRNLIRRFAEAGVTARFLNAWEDDAELNTFGEAVAEVIEFRSSEGEPVETSVDDWRRFAARASLYAAREKAHELGVDVDWGCEAARTPEGYYQVRGGILYAIAKSLAAAPFADLLWMETKTANLDERASSPRRFTRSFPTRCSLTKSRSGVEHRARAGT